MGCLITRGKEETMLAWFVPPVVVPALLVIAVVAAALFR
jgi:hypothetical protein